jgi:dTDP-4-amino-4,6-dideoxygalactose transaminase
MAVGDAVVSPRDARDRLRAYLQDRFQCQCVLLTGSGTQALTVALETGGSSIAALPAYNCYDIVTAAIGSRSRVLFYDIDPVSLSPDIDSLRRALERGARRVVAGNLFGFPLDWDTIRALCRQYDATLIEDAAQGLSSEWRGQIGGCFGDLTVLSFARGKGWTGGGGGALLIRRTGVDVPRLSHTGVAASLSTLAGLVSQWTLGRPALYGLPSAIPGLHLGVTRYRVPQEARTIPSVCAAVALRHAAVAEAAAEPRRLLAEKLREGLGRSRTVRGSLCRPLSGGVSGFLRLPIVASGEDEAHLLALEGRSLGLQRGYPRPLSCLPQVAALLEAPAHALSGAKLLSERLLTIPTHSLVSAADAEALTRLLTTELTRATRSHSSISISES